MAKDKEHPVKAWRSKHKKTLGELEILSGVDYCTISRIENGLLASAEASIRLHRATGVPLAVLKPDLWKDEP